MHQSIAQRHPYFVRSNEWAQSEIILERGPEKLLFWTMWWLFYQAPEIWMVTENRLGTTFSFTYLFISFSTYLQGRQEEHAICLVQLSFPMGVSSFSWHISTFHISSYLILLTAFFFFLKLLFFSFSLFFLSAPPFLYISSSWL